jgi:hypothetical protein
LPDHRDFMVALAKREGWQRGVEVGLGHGLLFARLCDVVPGMIGVDLGRRPERRRQVEQINGKVHWMASVEAAKEVFDAWADFVFIDAAHSYEAVKADIAVWQPKVRTGGWFGGHDYHPSHPGVIRAVDEAFPNRRLLEHWIWARA